MCMCYEGRRVEFDFSFTDYGVKNWYKHFKMNFTIFRKVELHEANNYASRCFSQLTYKTGHKVTSTKDVLCRIFA